MVRTAKAAPRRRHSRRPFLGAAIGLLLAAGALPAHAVGVGGWFVSLEEIFVAPVERSDVTQLVDGGTIETDGFSELVFSLGGEFKESRPTGGVVGAILLPDSDIVDYLLRSEGEFVFPLEVRADVSGMKNHIFMSEQQTARVAFPRYRVYFYNETTSAAQVSLYVYRSR